MDSFLIKDHRTNTTVEYSNIIEPIKDGDKFLPNFEQLEKKGAFILKEDFVKNQILGKTIIVNKNGGWCFLDKDMEIVN